MMSSPEDHAPGAVTDDEQGPLMWGLAGAAAASARLIRQRPTKLQIAALCLITLLSFGPLFAILAVARTDEGPVQTLIEGAETPVAGAHLVATLTGVSATAGEMRTRIEVQPHEELLEAGRPTVDLVLHINDVRGANTYDFPRGEPLRPIEVSLALTGGSVIRYPFDEYDAGLSVTLANEASGDAEPVLFSLDVLSNVDEFDVAANPGEDLLQPTAWAVVPFDVARETTTTAYAVWTMALMWGLAIAGVMIAWAVTIWQVELPIWSFGYLVGVLFALPQLRELLPGRPPPGTLLDFVAFYWSIAIVGVTLIAVLMIWIQRARPNPAARGSR
jgi:hypothetical protein